MAIPLAIHLAGMFTVTSNASGVNRQERNRMERTSTVMGSANNVSYTTIGVEEASPAGDQGNRAKGRGCPPVEREAEVLLGGEMEVCGR